MRVSFSPIDKGFVVKVNGIGVYWANKQSDAMLAFNLIQQGKFIAVFKALYKRAKRGGYTHTARRQSLLILQCHAAIQGESTGRFHGRNDIYAGSPLSTAKLYGLIEGFPAVLS